jgi:tRNA (guanine-N7-)-methyltransferase
MTLESPEKKHRIRSFVRREGRMTDAQKNALSDLWPRYGNDVASGLFDFDTRFKVNGPRVLEIGFGMGTSLVSMAKALPTHRFLGVEVHRPGVGKCLSELARFDLDNVQVYCHDAVDVLRDCIKDHDLDCIQIFFPDPWPKKRHHKRRLIQTDFIRALLPKLSKTGRLHLATDWAPYAEHMLDVLSHTEGLHNVAGVNQFHPKPKTRPLTKFEARGQGLGHEVFDLIFTLDPCIDPPLDVQP